MAFEIAPVLLLGFLAGAIVDRRSRRSVMVMADLGRAGIALALVAFGDNLALIYAAAFGLSVGTVFFNPAASSLRPSVVHRDDLVEANSALWSAAVVSQIALACRRWLHLAGFPESRLPEVPDTLRLRN